MLNNVDKKYLGIDWGEKRIGLALGDSETRLASPFKAVKDLEEIKRIVKEEGIEEIVIGVPEKMGGQKDLSPDFVNFLELVKQEIPLPINTVDERLSSKAADALEGGKKSAGWRKGERDAVAAMIILQSFLDNLGGGEIYGRDF